MKRIFLFIVAMAINNANAQTDFTNEHEFISIASCSALAQLHRLENKTKFSDIYATEFSRLAYDKKLQIDPLKVNQYLANINEELTGYLNAMVSKEEKVKGIRMSKKLFKKTFKGYGCMKYYFSILDKELVEFKKELSTDDFNALRESIFEIYVNVPEDKELK